MAQVDEAKLNQFIGKMLGDLGGAFSVPTVRLGLRLGLFTALHEGGRRNSGSLRRGIHREGARGPAQRLMSINLNLNLNRGLRSSRWSAPRNAGISHRDFHFGAFGTAGCASRDIEMAGPTFASVHRFALSRGDLAGA